MSVEVLEAQEQLQRARDNLRHVEEGIKKTATSSNLRCVVLRKLLLLLLLPGFVLHKTPLLCNQVC